MVNLAVIGSRQPSAQSVAATLRWIDNFREVHSTEEIGIVTGGAFGMDSEAMQYAFSQRLRLKVFVPGKFHNERLCNALSIRENCEIIYTRLGYLERNTLVIEHSDVVVSSDYGNGTIDSIEKAVRLEKPVFILGNYISSPRRRRELPQSPLITVLPI